MLNRKRLLVFLVAVACAGGCETTPPVTTKIVSEPPGARIEVNRGYVGTAPMDVTLRQTASRHRLKEQTIIRALPTQPGQKPQEVLLIRHQIPPERILFDMTYDASAGPAETAQPPVEPKSPGN